MTKKLPELPANLPARNDYKHTNKFGVIVICKDEAEHKTVYERLSGQGFSCKAVKV